MGFFDDLFGDAPKGNYETKDTTTFIQSIFGERSFEVEDKRTGETGRGEGDNARDAKSDAFHHLKEASQYDPKYTAGPQPVNTSSSGSSGDSGSYSGGGSYSSYGGGCLGVLVFGAIVTLGIYSILTKPISKPPVLEKKVEYVQPEYERYQPKQLPLVSKKYSEKFILPREEKPIIKPPRIEEKLEIKDNLEEIILKDMSELLSSFKNFKVIKIDDSSLAINVGGYFYYRVKTEDFSELESIRENYNQLCRSHKKSRYQSALQTKNAMLSNIEEELKSVITKHVKLNDEELSKLNGDICPELDHDKLKNYFSGQALSPGLAVEKTPEEKAKESHKVKLIEKLERYEKYKKKLDEEIRAARIRDKKEELCDLTMEKGYLLIEEENCKKELELCN